MAVPGLEYSIWIFDGMRVGKKICHGYGACIYDSAGVQGPEEPVISNPNLSIDENSAGTVEFSILNKQRLRIAHNSEGPSGTVDYIDDQLLTDYVFYKQTEVVIYRRINRKDGTYVDRELWMGRVAAIKKDLRNTWSIMAEGPFTYLQDFAMDAVKFQAPVSTNAGSLLRNIIDKFNVKITTASTGTFSTVTVRNPSGNTLTFRQLNRHISVLKVSDNKLPYVATSKVSGLDDTFEVNHGTKFYEVIQNLFSRFGGHMEFVPCTDANGYSQCGIKWYGDKEYKTGSMVQNITFGLNLLDYSEDLEDSDFYTALLPLCISSESVETVDPETQETKTETKTKYIDVSTAKANKHPGSKYVYDDAIVRKYGFIEHIEQWNLNDPNDLYNVAEGYYKDQAIGEPVINVSAFDLKNLVNTDFKDDSYYSIDSLYLYDMVTVSSAYSTYTLPIVGIQIPLDKFPVNTKYTITNSKRRKTALAPQNVIKRAVQETPVPTAPAGSGADAVPEESEKYVPLAGNLAGIDVELAHYPVIYMMRCRIYMNDYYLYGYRIDSTGMVNHNHDDRSPGTVFYSDDIKSMGGTTMREARTNAGEQIGNRYEKVYTSKPDLRIDGKEGPGIYWEITPFTSAYQGYFQGAPEANIDPSQAWAKSYSGDHASCFLETKMNTGDGTRKYINGGPESGTIDNIQCQTFLINMKTAIEGLKIFDGSTVAAALQSMGVSLRYDATYNDIYLDMPFQPGGYGDSYTITGALCNAKERLKNTYSWPQEPSATTNGHYYGCVQVLNASDASIIFASMDNGENRPNLDNMPYGSYYMSTDSSIKDRHMYENAARYTWFKRQMFYFQATYNLVPVMIITKTKDLSGSSGSSEYGLIFNRNCNMLTPDSVANRYRMQYTSTVGTSNYLPFAGYSSSVPTGPVYLYTNNIFISDDLFSINTETTPPTITINNPSWIDVEQSNTHASPLTVLTKHGGSYTTHVCEGVYQLRSGENRFQPLQFKSALVYVYNPASYDDNKANVLTSPTTYMGQIAYPRDTSTRTPYQLYSGENRKDQRDFNLTGYPEDDRYAAGMYTCQNYFYTAPVIIGGAAYYKIGYSRLYVKM